ncbi:hypothetical protein JOC37_000277 [Desulfohalotomaculum tongense]|nr:hypothetical protein [Desulforadius tongensis]
MWILYTRYIVLIYSTIVDIFFKCGIYYKFFAFFGVIIVVFLRYACLGRGFIADEIWNVFNKLMNKRPVFTIDVQIDLLIKGAYNKALVQRFY